MYFWFRNCLEQTNAKNFQEACTMYMLVETPWRQFCRTVGHPTKANKYLKKKTYLASTTQKANEPKQTSWETAIQRWLVNTPPLDSLLPRWLLILPNSLVQHHVPSKGTSLSSCLLVNLSSQTHSQTHRVSD